MNCISLIVLLVIFYNACEAGVTVPVAEIPPDSSEGEAVVETISDDSWMPSNIFDVKPISDVVKNDFRISANEFSTVAKEVETTANPQESGILNLFSTEAPWDSDSSPIFRAIRDFIFQASDGVLEPEELRNDDPTDEIVRFIEKGLIEATTMFLNPSEEPVPTTTTAAATGDTTSDISIIKIENVSPDTMLDRIGMNVVDLPSSRQASIITNITIACSNCYNSLQTCVQKCFAENNCNDVKRQTLVCPTPTTRLCNIFAQWGPVDECRVHEDCTSPLLCCHDGCANKCSPGVWQD